MTHASRSILTRSPCVSVSLRIASTHPVPPSRASLCAFCVKFIAPLLSWFGELFSPQPPSFDNHPDCPPRCGTYPPEYQFEIFRLCVLCVSQANSVSKSFRMRSYEKRTRKSFRIRSYRIPRGVGHPFPSFGATHAGRRNSFRIRSYEGNNILD
jgi:hypothetical protein